MVSTISRFSWIAVIASAPFTFLMELVVIEGPPLMVVDGPPLVAFVLVSLSAPVRPFRIANTESTMTASMPASLCI